MIKTPAPGLSTFCFSAKKRKVFEPGCPYGHQFLTLAAYQICLRRHFTEALCFGIFLVGNCLLSLFRRKNEKSSILFGRTINGFGILAKPHLNH